MAFIPAAKPGSIRLHRINPGRLTDRTALGHRNPDHSAKDLCHCGYHDFDVNNEALRVMRLFCLKARMRWRFGVAIGEGMVVSMMRKVPLVNHVLNKACNLIAADIRLGGRMPVRDISITPIIPKAVIKFMKDSPLSRKFISQS